MPMYSRGDFLLHWDGLVNKDMDKLCRKGWRNSYQYFTFICPFIRCPLRSMGCKFLVYPGGMSGEERKENGINVDILFYCYNFRIVALTNYG